MFEEELLSLQTNYELSRFSQFYAYVYVDYVARWPHLSQVAQQCHFFYLTLHP